MGMLVFVNNKTSECTAFRIPLYYNAVALKQTGIWYLSEVSGLIA